MIEVDTNKVRDCFIDELRKIKREDCDIDGLIAYLDSHEFFTSPATTKYHSSFKGGLALHSLQVYRNLCDLVSVFATKEVPNPEYVPLLDREPNVEYAEIEPTIRVPVYDSDSLLILGLLHDVSKAGMYESYYKNKKVYVDEPTKQSKKDDLGYFEWKSEEAFQVKEASDRMIAGSRAFNSYYITSMFIPMTHEEMSAMINQTAGTDKTENISDLGEIMSKFNLTVFLHCADMISSYCQEKFDEE